MHVFQCVRGFAMGGTQLRGGGGGGGIPGSPPSVSNPDYCMLSFGLLNEESVSGVRSCRDSL